MLEHYLSIKNKLQDTSIKDIIYLDYVDSTNDYAHMLAIQGYPSGTVVVANRQLKGRGRQHNKWYSPQGNLYASILLKPKDINLEISAIIPAFTYLGAISSVCAISGVYNVKTTLKWPNDIVFKDRKLGGVLTEARISGNEIVFVIIGIGLNVNIDMSAFPEDIVQRVISLSHICGKVLDIPTLLLNILIKFDDFYKQIKTEGLAPIINVWLQNSSTLQRNVRVVDGDILYEGIAEGLDDMGRLLIRDFNGKIFHLSNGHLYFL
ncbi:MAG: biotin--[acetyl-CoA-carboxylase] ligase [Thermodesulfovibrionales bacterium]